MYIFEFIIRLFNKNKEARISEKEVLSQDVKSDDICKHVFLPVDSTGEVLACSKCGLIIKSSDVKIKSKNPFTM